jgi:hypothetical protein
MSKAISISIPQPCHENWNAMTPNEQGRFCGVCSKTVMDFTDMTDNAIYDIFNKHKEGTICGRFRNSQLDRNMLPLQTPQWYKANIWKYAIAGALVFTVMQQAANAQVGHKTLGRVQPKFSETSSKVKVTCAEPPTPKHNKWELGEVAVTTIKGDTIIHKTNSFLVKLSDSAGKPVNYAYINADNEQTKITEKGDGLYRIETNENIVTLVARHPDFVMKTIVVNYNEQFVMPHITPHYLNVNMVNEKKVHTMVSVGVVIVSKYNTNETALKGTRNLSFTIKDEATGSIMKNATINYTIPKAKENGTLEKADNAYLLQHKTFKGSLKMTISAPDYETKEIIYTQKQLQKMIATNQTIYLAQTATKVDVVTENKPVVENTPAPDVVFKKIFPNPIQSGTICYISCVASKGKEVQVQLLTVDGKVLATQKAQMVIGQNALPITIPTNITNQVIDVQVVENGKVIYSQLLIVQ